MTDRQTLITSMEGISQFVSVEFSTAAFLKLFKDRQTLTTSMEDISQFVVLSFPLLSLSNCLKIDRQTLTTSMECISQFVSVEFSLSNCLKTDTYHWHGRHFSVHKCWVFRCYLCRTVWTQLSISSGPSITAWTPQTQACQTNHPEKLR